MGSEPRPPGAPGKIPQAFGALQQDGRPGSVPRPADFPENSARKSLENLVIPAVIMILTTFYGAQPPIVQTIDFSTYRECMHAADVIKYEDAIERAKAMEAMEAHNTNPNSIGRQLTPRATPSHQVICVTK
jgi:hypothetical protein